MGHAQQARPEAIGDPNVAATVDCKSAVVYPRFEVLDFARIGSRKTRHVIHAAVGDPDSIVPVDPKVKRRSERLARFLRGALAHDSALRTVAFRKIHELVLLDAQSPDVAGGSDDDPLHQAEPAAERNALRRRKRFPVFVEHGDRLAAVAGKPHVIVSVDRCTERASLHATTAEARGYRRKRLTVRCKLTGVTLPQRVLALPTNGEIVTHPEVALTVEHCLAARAIAAAVEPKREDPGARRPVEVGHVRHVSHVICLRHRIHKVEKPEDPIRFIPGVVGDGFGRGQRISWSSRSRRRCGGV